MSTHQILQARSRTHHWSGSGLLSLKSFTRGYADYTVGRARYRVDEDCYLLLNHGQEYTICVDAPTAVDSFCLFFAPGFGEEIFRSVHESAHTLLDSPTQRTTQSLHFFERTYPHDTLLSPALAHLRHWYPQRKAEAGWLEEQLHTVMQCMVAVHHRTHAEANSISALRAATREELYRRLYLAYDLIQAAYEQPLTLAAMAEVAALSPNHFLRSFKALFHQTPHQCLTARRIHQAQRLLRTTDDSITTICFAVGFESLGSFSWLFHRRVGMTPAQYRQQKGDFEEAPERRQAYPG